jgi:Fe-S cluster assembly protein SufD
MSTQLMPDANRYEAAFRLLREKSSAEPSWLRRAREEAFAQFEHVGFPTVQQEEWKYTNVAPIAKSQFTPASIVAGDAKQLGELGLEKRPGRLCFINGVFQRALSSMEILPGGVEVIDLSDTAALGQHESKVRAHFEAYGGDQANGFTALNTAVFSGGILLLIPKGILVSTPIELQFVSVANNGSPPAAFPRVLIVAEANSDTTIIESYSGVGSGGYFTDAIVDIALGAGARVQHVTIQRESNNAFHIATTKADLGPNAKYDATAINLGAALSRHTIDVMMDHEGAECLVDGLYMVDGHQHTDTHSMIDHRQPHCSSQQLYKGILDGKSRAVFNGKVFVRHGAQKTVAQQTNKNLLLSNEARVDTKPQLEIFADDVKCAHGAAIGQLEEDELFYLESRGINPTLASNMLTYGFAEEVIEKITVESIKRELDSVVLNRLSQGSGASGLEDLT